MEARVAIFAPMLKEWIRHVEPDEAGETKALAFCGANKAPYRL
jgi:hypothetical protein